MCAFFSGRADYARGVGSLMLGPYTGRPRDGIFFIITSATGAVVFAPWRLLMIVELLYLFSLK